MMNDETSTTARVLERIAEIEGALSTPKSRDTIPDITRRNLIAGVQHLRGIVTARTELNAEPMPVAEEMDTLTLQVLDRLSLVLASDDPTMLANLPGFAAAFESLGARLGDEDGSDE